MQPTTKPAMAEHEEREWFERWTLHAPLTERGPWSAWLARAALAAKPAKPAVMTTFQSECLLELANRIDEACGDAINIDHTASTAIRAALASVQAAESSPAEGNELPPLPEAEGEFYVNDQGVWVERSRGDGIPLFTAEQMRAYASTARANVQPKGTAGEPQACPFCGRSDRLKRETTGGANGFGWPLTKCYSCGACGPHEEGNGTTWNSRTQSPAPAPTQPAAEPASPAIGQEQTERLIEQFEYAVLAMATGRDDASIRLQQAKQAVRAAIAQAAPAHEPNVKLMALADRIDHEQLWRRPGLEHRDWPQEKQDQMMAGVNLRRYADLLGNGGWVIYPPRHGLSFRASTLDAVVSMAKRDEERRSDSTRAAPLASKEST